MIRKNKHEYKVAGLSDPKTTQLSTLRNKILHALWFDKNNDYASEEQEINISMKNVII